MTCLMIGKLVHLFDQDDLKVRIFFLKLVKGCSPNNSPSDYCHIIRHFIPFFISFQN